MNYNDHRKAAVHGLRSLAAFLEDMPITAPLNSASPVEITYVVLNEDQADARAEFNAVREFLALLRGAYGTTFTTNELDDTEDGAPITHHKAQIAFVNGVVRYSVLWIERQPK